MIDHSPDQSWIRAFDLFSRFRLVLPMYVVLLALYFFFLHPWLMTGARPRPSRR
jgi:hypothetical protein